MAFCLELMGAKSSFLRSFHWLLLGGCLALSHASPLPTAADSPPRDFTLVIVSDIHLGAENLKAKEPFTKTDFENVFRKPDGSGAGSCYGPTANMQMIRELFRNCIAASQILRPDAQLRGEFRQEFRLKKGCLEIIVKGS